MTQAPEAPARTRAQISERTLRTDPWWKQPGIVAAGLSIWVTYATVHVFIGKWYYVPADHYLTPFYSPCVSGECVPGSSALGQWIPGRTRRSRTASRTGSGSDPPARSTTCR